jgi:hypothetical protein
VTYVPILRGLYSLIRHHFSSPNDNDTWAQTSGSRSRRVGETTKQKFQVLCDTSLGGAVEELLWKYAKSVIVSAYQYKDSAFKHVIFTMTTYFLCVYDHNPKGKVSIPVTRRE